VIATVALVTAGCTHSGTDALNARPSQVAWVANGGFVSQPGNTVTPVDLATRTTGDPVATASQPVAIAAVPGHTELLVANQGHDTVSVVDTTTGQVTTTVGVGLDPSAVAATENLAVVANFGADTVSVVDLNTGRVKATIPVGHQPDAVAIDPTMGTNNAGVALVADYGSNTATPVDLGALAALPAVAVGSEPDAVEIAGTTALVADFGSNTVTPIALDQPGFPAEFPLAVPGSPTGIAVTPNATTAWVSGGSSLTPITLATLIPGIPVTLHDVAEAVAITPNGSTAWVAQQGGTLVPVTLANGVAGRPLTVGGRPSAVVIAG
jgi:YVTN family beta-propeller protein